MITHKWLKGARSRHGPRTDFMIAWPKPSIRGNEVQSINVPEELWDQLEVGDRIEVFHFGSSESPYLREGIFASNGNIKFACLLFLLEIGVSVAMIVILFRNRSTDLSEY